jgi:hypothetical protein
VREAIASRNAARHSDATSPTHLEGKSVASHTDAGAVRARVRARAKARAARTESGNSTQEAVPVATTTVRRSGSTRERLYVPDKNRTASTVYMREKARATLSTPGSRDLRSRSSERPTRTDFDRRRSDRTAYDRRRSDRRSYGDYDRKGGHDRHYRDRKRHEYRRGHNRCRHGHYGSCYLCSRGYKRSGWSFSLSWGWPYYYSCRPRYHSWYRYGSYVPWYGRCYTGLYSTYVYFGSSYGCGLRYIFWPSYVYGSLYDDVYYYRWYPGAYIDDPGPTHYTDLIDGGVPDTVYEELPPVTLPSPKDSPEPDHVRRIGSVLSPMLGGADHVETAFVLGEARFRRGEFAGAVAAFEESVLTGTAEPSARIALALALTGAEDYSGAAQVLRIGLQELPQVDAIALDVDALFPDRTVWDEALSRLRAAAQREPADPDLALLAGFTLFAVGDLQEATVFLWSAYESGMRDSGLAEVLLATEARLRGR